MDPRVGELYRRIDSGRYDLLSLDVFDTVVYRRVPRPTDAFFLLAHALRQRDAMRDSSSPEGFVRERINAEDRARRRKYFCTEVKLAEIYAEFPEAYLRGISREEMIEAELNVERELIRIDPRMKSIIEYSGRKGLKTAFVSDTYFTRDQISDFVKIHPDYTVLSCEHGMSKFQGLHRVLLEQSGIPPERILHVGDSLEADIEGPKTFGMDCLRFEKLPEPYEDLLRKELPETLSMQAPYMTGPDRGLSWMRSQSGFACGTDYARWGAVVLGPVIAGFAGWIMRKCKEGGIRQVLCLMREGRLLKKALDLLYPDKPFECHEFFISRYAALKASIYEANANELNRFVSRSSPPLVQDILDQLGLEGRDIDLSAEKILSTQDAKILVRRIAEAPLLRKKVVRSSREARENLLKHLSPMLKGVSRGEEVAVVDLGYSGTIQARLQEILSGEKSRLKTRGLYLVTGGRIHEVQALAIAEGWLADNNQPTAMAHTFMRSPQIVEQSLMAGCGTTLGHDAQGAPLLDALHIPAGQALQIQQIQDGILTFCRLWAGAAVGAVADGKDDPAFADQLKAICRRILIRCVAEPLDHERKLFGAWIHDENLGSGNGRSLTGCRLDDWELSHASVHQLASLPMEEVYWPFGLAGQIGGSLGQAVAHVFQRTVHPWTFDSGLPEQPLTFHWDTGTGFNSRNSRLGTYRMSNRNRVWKRFSLELDHARLSRLGFSIGRPGEAIQLTGIKLHFQDATGREERVRIGHGEIEKRGYRYLHDSLYAVEDQEALLIANLNGAAAFSGTMHADIFFALIQNGTHGGGHDR